jgi:hypothetical protein
MSEKHYTIRQQLFDAFAIVAKGLEEPRDLARLALLLRTAGHSLTLHATQGPEHEIGLMLEQCGRHVEGMCRRWTVEELEKAAEETGRAP